MRVGGDRDGPKVGGQVRTPRPRVGVQTPTSLRASCGLKTECSFTPRCVGCAIHIDIEGGVAISVGGASGAIEVVNNDDFQNRIIPKDVWTVRERKVHDAVGVASQRV